jgi:hypothetical protein
VESTVDDGVVQLSEHGVRCYVSATSRVTAVNSVAACTSLDAVAAGYVIVDCEVDDDDS